MFKRHLNELTVHFTIAPDGPILIKAGDTGGMDPTRPDMEFVRAWYNGQETVYLPGSSLKGMIRAHCEKIARTVVSGDTRFCCDPLDEKRSCGQRMLEESKRREKAKEPALSSAEIYRRLCTICKLFGHTVMASHVRLSDAYPQDLVDDTKNPNRTEERHGVAIDRVYGSVAVGPFQFETVTRGRFQGTLTVRNFTTAQLGLIGLALRDLQAQRVNIGFAKSRGLGRIKTSFNRVSLRYPAGELLETADGQRIVQDGHIAGVAAFLNQREVEDYGYRAGDVAEASALRFQPDGWSGLAAMLEGEAALAIFQACVPAWAEAVRHGR